MIALMNKDTYSAYDGDNDFYIGISDSKNSIFDENLNEHEDEFFIIYKPLEVYCKNCIFFDKIEPNLNKFIRLIRKEDNIIYYNLEDNGIYLKINDEKVEVYINKPWGLLRAENEYIVSFCTYVSEKNNEDYVVYTEDIIEYVNQAGKRKIGIVKFENGQFVINAQDGTKDLMRDKRNILVSEVSILNKDSAFGEYTTKIQM